MARPSEKPGNLVDLISDYIKSTQENSELPSIAGLAVFIGFAKSTVYKWAEEDSEFSDALGSVSTLQEHNLINKSLNGEWNSAISKLLLHNHGYSDRSEQKHSGDQDNPIIHKVERVIVKNTKN